MHDYAKAMKYEIFVRRAHKSLRSVRNGADICFMKNAMAAEKGSRSVSHLGSFEKQFVKVQGYILKALDKFLKKRLEQEERDALEALKVRASQAWGTAQLLEVVNEGLNITDRFKG